MRKYAIYVSPSCLKMEGRHKLITLSSGDRFVTFIRGKDNVIVEKDKLIVLFSDMEKPVKFLMPGDRFKPGPTPRQIVQAFNLELFDMDVKEPEKKSFQKRSPRMTLEQKVEHSLRSLQELVASLPSEVNAAGIRRALNDLQWLKNDYLKRDNSPDQNPQP